MEILKIILSILPAWLVFAFSIGALRDLMDRKFFEATKSAAIAVVAMIILLIIWR